MEALPLHRGWELTNKVLGYRRVTAISAGLLQPRPWPWICRWSLLTRSLRRKGFWPDGVTGVEIDELVEEADYISLHCPLNDKTHNIINADRIKAIETRRKADQLRQGRPG